MSAPRLDLVRLRAALRCREMTPSSLVRLVHARIDERGDDAVWITRVGLDALLARAAALEAQPEADRGPLWGVPFAVKDNIDCAGLPTTAACPAFAYTPERDAPAVERLLKAGAVLVGKTNLDQFAAGLVGVRSPYGACANVFDARFIAGGSSSGSGVAVAAGLVSFSLGTDTAGSGRVPAAFGNIVGVKPTRGIVSTRGVVPACRSLDCVSVFALTAEDGADVLRVLAGFDAEDPYSRAEVGDLARREAPSRFRVAVPRRTAGDFLADPEVEGLFGRAVDTLVSMGAQVQEIDFAPFREAAALLYEGPWVAERWAVLEAFAAEQKDALHPVTRRVLERAQRFSAADAFRAQHRLAALRRRVESLWSEVDALVVPTAVAIDTLDAVAAEPVRLNAQLGEYTQFVNLLDLCAVAVPAGFRSNGLPFGVTLAGPALADARLSALAARFHRSTSSTLGATGHAFPEAPMDPVTEEPLRIPLAVVGTHLSDQPLNHELRAIGATLTRACRTAPVYRMYALTTTPPKPGLIRVAEGAAIEAEVWSLDPAAFGTFVSRIPSPLGIGTVELEDGTTVKGFLCEPYAVAGAPDISAHGGWRAYLKDRRVASGTCGGGVNVP